MNIMELKFESEAIAPQTQIDLSRRQDPRFSFSGTADWDFFTSAEGAKAGYVENISQGGCLLRASEPIEHRRWIRIVVKERSNGLWFTSVGRVIRREDKLEPWDEHTMTLYRYGVEFVHPLNPLILARIQESQSSCASCGNAEARIQDIQNSERFYCVLCHLRRACQNLLVQPDDSAYEQDPLESA
jgi:hypothetical protein